MKNILMVGFHAGYSEAFAGESGLEFSIIEDPGVFRRRREQYDKFRHKRLAICSYGDVAAFVDLAKSMHVAVPFDAVIPGYEYGVETAARIADALNLPGPGPAAIAACTDKLRLRDAVRDSDIKQPRYAQARTVEDVHRFYRGTPFVLKPTNRRASVGVIRIDDATQIDEAWSISTSATDPDESAIASERRFIVEEFVAGYNVSLETLAVDGEIVFQNVTLLEVRSGRRFPLVSVTAPAPVSAADYAEICAAGSALSKTLDHRCGLLHSEWAIDASGAYLVECAARVPGVFIAEVIEQAYGFNLYAATIRSQCGLPTQVVPAVAGATVRYFQPPAGILTGVRGTEVLARHSDVFLSALGISPGTVVPSFEDSWHRVGYFGVVGVDAESAVMTAKAIESNIIFDVVSASSEEAKA